MREQLLNRVNPITLRSKDGARIKFEFNKGLAFLIRH